MLLNSPPMASGWEQMLTAVRNHSTLPASLRELMIIRVAALNGATFECEAHLPTALEAGATHEKIAALVQPDRIGPGLSEMEHTLIALPDTMTRQVKVPAELSEQVRGLLDERQVVDANCWCCTRATACRIFRAWWRAGPGAPPVTVAGVAAMPVWTAAGAAVAPAGGAVPPSAMAAVLPPAPAEQPATRKVILYGQVFREGGLMAAQLRIEQIRPRSVVPKLRRQRFELAL